MIPNYKYIKLSCEKKKVKVHLNKFSNGDMLVLFRHGEISQTFLKKREIFHVTE
jgi:hypothetical protein